MRKEIKLFSNTLPFVILIAAVMFPVQFPKQEIGLKAYADEINANKVIYEKLTTLTNKDDVIFSDASDAVWWYSDRYTIWIPVVYEDFKTIAQRESIDYIFLEKPSNYFDILTENELVDFFTITKFVEGDPLGWGLYKININDQIKE